jgi:hypothetical protein
MTRSTDRFAVEPGARERANEVLRQAGLDVEAGSIELDRRDERWPIVMVTGDVADDSPSGRAVFADSVDEQLTAHVNVGLGRRMRESRIFRRSRQAK